ncbi:hypothetical protein [Clavibacter zhangzhiyongii]|uniref:hypothetical protein n=1 Tax=Clavibacter zhangzhiyongii TaxID=2768071 RepID=UPI0039E113FA
MSMSEPLVPRDHSDDAEITAADAGDGAPVETTTEPAREDVRPDDPAAEATDADAAEGAAARESVLRRPSGERLAPEELAAESE